MNAKPLLVIRVPGSMELDEAGLTSALQDYHVFLSEEPVTKIEFEVHSVEKEAELNPEKLNELIELISKKQS